MSRVVLLTGCNLGNKPYNILSAERYIAEFVGRISKSSEIYKSSPWGFESDDSFLNQILVVETELSPIDILNKIQEIERSMGRTRVKPLGDKKVYSSRTMDIDILFYDDLVINSERLTIPHPLICEREFVLKPLREILGDFIHPTKLVRIKDIVSI